MTDQSGAFPETLREAPCNICGAERTRCEAGVLCAKGCDDALLDAIEAYYDTCRPDGAPADSESRLRTAIAAFWKARAALERPRLAPPESRSPYDGMVDFTPEQALRWALDYIADGSDETPPHVCEFDSDPTTGACDFHERYWAARESLDWLARGGSAGTGAAPPSEALTRSRIDHWLRNRNLVMYRAGMNKSMGYGGTIEAIMALMDDLAEYAER